MSTQETPKVTVLIPVRDRERYIPAAIESVLGQTMVDLELLVVDDASSDASCQAVLAYADPRVRLVRNETHLGIPATRNRGIDLARGQYVAFLDSDDTARPERLEKQVAFLDAHPAHAAVGAWIEWMDEQGRPLGRVKRKATRAEDIAAERLFRTCLENSASTARAELLRKYRHREHYELGSDYDLWARIAADHKLSTLPEVLVYRRSHSGRTTRGKVERIKGLRLEIFAEQLAGLGVAFESEDLERHYLLRRMHKTEFRPDAAYLAWAGSWLSRLAQANASRGCYPEPEFTRVLAGFWLKACWFATPALGVGAWRSFWSSPLRRGAWPELRRSLGRRVFRSSA